MQYGENSLSAKEIIATIDSLQQEELTEEEILFVTGIEIENSDVWVAPMEWSNEL